MSEMVERLARAMVAFLITKDPTTPPWDDADEGMRDAMREAVRHQIAAMREPTAAMWDACTKAQADFETGIGWGVMIDEALK